MKIKLYWVYGTKSNLYTIMMLLIIMFLFFMLAIFAAKVGSTATQVSFLQ